MINDKRAMELRSQLDKALMVINAVSTELYQHHALSSMQCAVVKARDNPEDKKPSRSGERHAEIAEDVMESYRVVKGAIGQIRHKLNTLYASKHVHRSPGAGGG